MRCCSETLNHYFFFVMSMELWGIPRLDNAATLIYDMHIHTHSLMDFPSCHVI